MAKIILITGSTDGIGLETAKMLAAEGHHLLLHGRNPAKMETALEELRKIPTAGPMESYIADFSNMAEVAAFAVAVSSEHKNIDVLINNAGILKAPQTVAADGIDIRFAVNTHTPFLLTRSLLPLLGRTGRVVNLSSAAQSPVDLEALAGHHMKLDDMEAYAQSKLAITMWTNHLAAVLGTDGPMVVSVNPGSLLASKMVKEGFGVEGSDIRIGADILCRAALSDEFADASGKYFDNDKKRFGPPHADALAPEKCAEIVRIIEEVLARS